MAFREVNPEDVPSEGNFLKIKDLFRKIGDTFVGVYVSNSSGSYGEDYTFEVKGEEKTLTVKGQLASMLKHANLSRGEKVYIKFVKEEEVGKDSPKRIFKVRVEEAPKPKADEDPPF